MVSLIAPVALSWPFLNQLIVLAINAIGLIVIMAVAIRKTFRDKLTSVFVTMGLLMFLWIDFAYLARVVGDQSIFWSDVFLRIAWVATPPFFAYVYLITVHMVGREKQLALLNYALLSIAFLLSAATAFSNYVIEGVSFTDGNLDILYGRGFFPFMGLISLYIVATLIPIFRAKLPEHRRRRVNTFLTGVLIFYGANLAFNIALPVFFDITHLYYFGDYSLLAIVGFTAYAIMRYRLLDIRSVIFRSVSFTLLAATFFALYGAILYGGASYLQQFNLSAQAYAGLTLLNVIVAVPAFLYYRRTLRQLTKRFLFQNKVDYGVALVQLSQALSATIDIEQVTGIVMEAMKETVRSGKTVILLRNKDGDQFIPHATFGAKDFTNNLSRDYALVQHLVHSGGPVAKDQLDIDVENVSSSQHKEEIELTKRAFEWLDIDVAVPLYVNKQITGMILLGNKLTGEPYLHDDVDFLAGFSSQAAVALENARLFKESQEFAKRLEREVAKATADLKVANEQLRDLDKAKTEFLNVASHQLYTPLTAIRGYLSMLLEGDFGGLKKEQRPIFDILNKSADRLIMLIKNLLDISRIERGSFELNLAEITFPDIVHEIVQDLLPNAMNKQLQLNYIPPESPVETVIGDEERLRQVVLNFIDNSIKYTERGSVDVRAYQERDEVVFSVSDTGLGLAPDEIPKLFTKFTRVGGASQHHTEGSGLGLYVVKQVVQEHNGTVRAESEGRGRGSTFSMRLPAQSSPRSLKLGDTATVVIKAAETAEQPVTEKVAA